MLSGYGEISRHVYKLMVLEDEKFGFEKKLI
jgi:hypothetical protein